MEMLSNLYFSSSRYLFISVASSHFPCIDANTTTYRPICSLRNHFFHHLLTNLSPIICYRMKNGHA